MEAWEVLERAAALIERDGWFSLRQGLCEGAHARCASNAIAACSPASYQGYHNVAHPALARAIGGTVARDIFAWNDAPGRTKEEVIAMLRTCAASLKAARTAGTRQPVAASTDAGVDAGHAALMERMS